MLVAVPIANTNAEVAFGIEITDAPITAKFKPHAHTSNSKNHATKLRQMASAQGMNTTSQLLPKLRHADSKKER